MLSSISYSIGIVKNIIFENGSFTKLKPVKMNFSRTFSVFPTRNYSINPSLKTPVLGQVTTTNLKEKLQPACYVNNHFISSKNYSSTPIDTQPTNLNLSSNDFYSQLNNISESLDKGTELGKAMQEAGIVSEEAMWLSTFSILSGGLSLGISIAGIIGGTAEQRELKEINEKLDLLIELTVEIYDQLEKIEQKIDDVQTYQKWTYETQDLHDTLDKIEALYTLYQSITNTTYDTDSDLQQTLYNFSIQNLNDLKNYMHLVNNQIMGNNDIGKIILKLHLDTFGAESATVLYYDYLSCMQSKALSLEMTMYQALGMNSGYANQEFNMWMSNYKMQVETLSTINIDLNLLNIDHGTLNFFSLIEKDGVYYQYGLLPATYQAGIDQPQNQSPDGKNPSEIVPDRISNKYLMDLCNSDDGYKIFTMLDKLVTQTWTYGDQQLNGWDVVNACFPKSIVTIMGNYVYNHGLFKLKSEKLDKFMHANHYTYTTSYVSHDNVVIYTNYNLNVYNVSDSNSTNFSITQTSQGRFSFKHHDNGKILKYDSELHCLIDVDKNAPNPHSITTKLLPRDNAKIIYLQNGYQGKDQFLYASDVKDHGVSHEIKIHTDSDDEANGFTFVPQ